MQHSRPYEELVLQGFVPELMQTLAFSTMLFFLDFTLAGEEPL